MGDSKTKDTALERLGRLVGTWATEATHPMAPGLVVHGTVEVEWLEGERFLIHRARTDHPEFPDSISILGRADRDRAEEGGEGAPITMSYFDSRGVSRVYEVSVDDEGWTISRDAPGFSQRYRGVFADGGRTMAGVWQLSEDGAPWNDDLAITYRRTNR